MIDWFGIKARKERKEKEQKEKEALELLEAAERKKAYQDRKERILSYLTKYDNEIEEKCNEEYEKEKKEAEEKNSTCPRCGSRNVVHKITRTKGEIHGNGTSSSFGSIGGNLFGIDGYVSSYGHSTIDGELDTLQINRCKDCEEEWNIEEVEKPSSYSAFCSYSSYAPGFLFRRIEDYYEMKYDPRDVKNEFNSLEEMRDNFLKRYSLSWYFQDYKKAPRYMIEYALFKGMTEHYYTLENLDKNLFNYKECDDAYSYTMTDEMWEVVKKMIGWEGETNDN